MTLRVLPLAFGFLIPFFADAASLIPRSEQISDADATAELARQLSAADGREAEALNAVNRVLSDGDADATEMRALRAGLLLRLSRTAEAKADLEWVLSRNPADSASRQKLANLLAAEQHARESRAEFERLHTDSLEYAAQMQGWGDFGRARRIIEKSVAADPASASRWLDLGAVDRGAQRFKESGEAYRKAHKLAPSAAAMRGLALTQLLEKDYRSAVETATAILAADPSDGAARSIRAQAEFAAMDYDSAAADFAVLSHSRSRFAEGFIGLGRIALARGDNDAAIESFKLARPADPVGAQYFIDRARSPETPSAPQSIQNSPARLTEWARLLTSDGFYPQAIETYQQALTIDSEYHPAAIGLVEAYAANHDYREARDLIARMSEDFPDNYKLLLTEARILSWAKDYEESEDAYRQLIDSDPGNPAFRRELARVHAWDKEMRDATRVYKSLWEPPVDDSLLAALELPAQSNAELAIILDEARDHQHAHRPFVVYEELSRAAADTTGRTQAELDAALLEYSAEYRLQRSAWLESRAKNEMWNRHFLRAEDDLEDLNAFDPGNQEAAFDLAQAQAAQGLRRRAISSYERLLTLDRLHQQASLALEREEILNSPAAQVSYLFLDEDGSDRLSDITRQRIRETFELPIDHDYYFRVSANQWFESPNRFETTYTAQGPSFEVGGIFNEYLSASGSFVYKNYNKRGIEDTFGGSARLTFNAWDYVKLGAAYLHEDVIHNIYGIEQGTQSDSIELSANSWLNHWFEIDGLAAYRHYNDNNNAFESRLTAGAIVLDHPTTLKLLAGGEFRDTEKESKPIFDDGEQVNVIFPYWTPQNYFRGIVSIEWRHDLAKFFFADAELHYYALRVSGSYDTDSNPSIGFEGEYRFDFLQRWSFHVIGGLERSPQWDGASAWSSLTYRF